MNASRGSIRKTSPASEKTSATTNQSPAVALTAGGIEDDRHDDERNHRGGLADELETLVAAGNGPPIAEREQDRARERDAGERRHGASRSRRHASSTRR